MSLRLRQCPDLDAIEFNIQLFERDLSHRFQGALDRRAVQGGSGRPMLH